MSKKVLIVYATRFGATKGTAEEIAKILREANLEGVTINMPLMIEVIDEQEKTNLCLKK